MEATRKQVKRAIWSLYLRGVKGADAIRVQLEEQFPGGFKASDRTIYRDCKDLEARYPPEQQRLDRPFQIHPDLPEGVTGEVLPAIIELNRGMQEGFIPGTVTIRKARWMSLLRPMLEQDNINRLYAMADAYASRERWAAIEGEEFDTKADLDLVLAYAPWRSDEHTYLYEIAVEAGVVPSIDEISRQNAIAKCPLDRNAANRIIQGLVHRDELRNRVIEAVQPIEDSLPEVLKDEFLKRMRDYLISNPDLDQSQRLEAVPRIAKDLMEETNARTPEAT